MIYTLIWVPAFIDDLKSLPTDAATAVANNVMGLVHDPRPATRTVLELDHDLYVLHVGDYDVMYDITGLTIRALLVTKRSV